MVNIPIADKWAIRAAGATEEQDGRTDFAEGNEFETNRKYGTDDLSSYRISSMFQADREHQLVPRLRELPQPGHRRRRQHGLRPPRQRRDRARQPEPRLRQPAHAARHRRRRRLHAELHRRLFRVRPEPALRQRRAGRFAQHRVLDLRGHAARAAAHQPVRPAPVLDRGPVLLRGREQHPLRHAARQLGLHAAGRPERRALDLRAAEPRPRVGERLRAGHVRVHRPLPLDGRRALHRRHAHGQGRPLDRLHLRPGRRPARRHRRAGLGPQRRAGLLLPPVQRHEGQLEQHHLDGARRVRPVRQRAALPVARHRLEVGRAAGRHGLRRSSTTAPATSTSRATTRCCRIPRKSRAPSSA